jgi:hypothetical protein
MRRREIPHTAHTVKIWKRIEVVITGLTRNQVAFTGSWVRIPPLPPSKNPVTMRVSGFFFFLRPLQKSPDFGLFFPQFWKEQLSLSRNPVYLYE